MLIKFTKRMIAMYNYNQIYLFITRYNLGGETLFKKIKSYVILCALISIVLVIAGCGAKQNTSQNDSNGTKATSTTEQTQQPAEAVELIVSAAASMTDALTEIEKAYEANHPNIELSFNFGASGALQQQIEQGHLPIYFYPQQLRI